VSSINAERIYTVVISEAVKHLHIHVVPRTDKMTIKGLDLIRQATQQEILAPNNLTDEDLLILVEKMKNFLCQKN
jgi:diadenosine tetraphosphate (Ap4A) HIT family hydrolase